MVVMVPNEDLQWVWRSQSEFISELENLNEKIGGIVKTAEL